MALTWVDMTHPDCTGTTRVPEKAVPGYEARGWVRADESAVETAKPSRRAAGAPAESKES